jgi:oligopeptide/dipeptide ABC transporter ATP-binding protein
MNNQNGYILELRNVRRVFNVNRRLPWRRKKQVKAVDGVSIRIRRGETMGLVGESGCGKSTLARVVLQLIRPTSGKIIFDGNDISEINKDKWRRLRCKMQMIFQDPLGSLNPRIKVGDQITEPLRVHGIGSNSDWESKAINLISRVGLRKDTMEKFPHQLSGGQRQRVVAARALVLEPTFLVCDEPVSALDVSIQAQAVNLLRDLQAEYGLTYLFISHDLRIVRHISHRVAVMYLGQIIEIAPANAIFIEARHPYTRALMDAVPVPDPFMDRSRELLNGEPPNPIDKPKGCAFQSRCNEVQDVCRRTEPKLKEYGHQHNVACHNA